jgi:hypothetical protein
MTFKISNTTVDLSVNKTLDILLSDNIFGGNTGPTGPNGAFTGPTGPTGPQGNSITGPTGSSGQSITGPTGSQGNSITGPTGSSGQSITGPTGSSGQSITGPTGPGGYLPNFKGPIILPVEYENGTQNPRTTGNIVLYYQLNYNSVTLNLRFQLTEGFYTFKCDLDNSGAIFSTSDLPLEIQPNENIIPGLGYQYMSVYDNDHKFLYAYPCVIAITGLTKLSIFLGKNIGTITAPTFTKNNYYGFGLSDIGGDPTSATVTYLLSQAPQQESQISPEIQQSDRRLKTEIKNIDVGLDFITQLNPVSYYKNSDKIEYGIIAQELEDVLNNNNIYNSGIISTDNQGMYSVRYNDFIAILMKSIQELKSIVDKQQLDFVKQRKINKKLKRLIKNDDKESVITEKESIISNKDIKESKILLQEEKDVLNNIVNNTSTCQYIFTKGKNVGNLCGKKTDNKFCKLHTK